MIEAMLVDDESLAIKMLLKLIDWKRLGINICATASDGKEALDAFHRYRPDLILTDIGMPGMNGLDFIKKIRETDRNTKFILISAHADFKYIQQAMRLGCADYILKPIDETELEKIIKKAAGHIRARSGVAARREREEAQKKKRVLMDYMKTGRENQAVLALEPDMAGTGLRLMSIDIVSEEAGRHEKAPQNIYDRKNYAERMLENIFTEFGEYLLFDREEESWIVLLREPDNNRLAARAEQVAAFVRTDLECAPKVCFTGAGGGLKSLPVLYDKLNQLRRYSFFLQSGDVRGYGYNCGENKNAGPESAALEAGMAAAIRSGDRDKAFRLLDEALEWSRRIDPSLLNNVYGFCYNAILLTREWYIAEAKGMDPPAALNVTYTQLASIKTPGGLREAVAKALGVMQNPPGGETGAARRRGVVEKGLKLLKERFASGVSLDDLCGELAVSKNYFCYLFKKETGRRIWEYLTEIRMAEAAKLLRETDLMSFEVAYRVGYDNASYFAKTFKRHYKKTPNEYRASST
ncbi:MAG: response regulator [Treponema sp.]|nr:response regulator [Treponema sp.]